MFDYFFGQSERTVHARCGVLPAELENIYSSRINKEQITTELIFGPIFQQIAMHTGQWIQFVRWEVCEHMLWSSINNSESGFGIFGR
jgi:hypothetical protein